MITAPAVTPPVLPGLDPSWSRILEIDDADGSRLGVHVLDRGPRAAELTLVCIHGNPTWSYLWRRVVDQVPDGVRVVAVDQVGMGYSARVAGPRRLAQRIDDLGAIIDALDIRGRLALMAHDWGGPITVGWAQRAVSSPRYADRIASIVLTNTAVHQARDDRAPKLILAARLPWLRQAVTADTTTFLRGTTALSSVDRSVARAFRAPYGRADRRQAISDFVADIPFEDDHPSQGVLASIAEGMGKLSGIPILLVWGMKDPVFAPRYLDDLRKRLPHAYVHQLADAGHLVLEDRPDVIGEIWDWITDAQLPVVGQQAETLGTSPLSALTQRANVAGQEPAIFEPVGEGWREVSWGVLHDRVRKLAQAFQQEGIAPGQRVGVLIPPGADLIACVYALWRIGATVVVIDAAHRPQAMVRALRGSRLDHMIAVRRAAPVVLALRLKGATLWRDRLAELIADVDVPLEETSPSVSAPDSDAVIVFTSGATGAAKPVAYSWARLAATGETLQAQYGFQLDDVLVAAFAPWAVMGPLLGLASVIPQMDASRPGTLTADALAEASAHAGGTVMWASPAAMRSVLSTAPRGSAQRERLQVATSTLRLLMVAGAPVSRGLLSEIVECWPECDVRTPYGMTEVLPATDVGAAEILQSADASGVLVGRALPGVEIQVAVLDAGGEPSADVSDSKDALGEIAIRAGHAKSRYDARAFDERRASRNPGWHRTGDVGRLDDLGRLWVEGRLAHVITTADGPIGPVSVEQFVQAGLADGWPDGGSITVAAVGVGPRGSQVIVVVCAPDVPGSSGRHRGVELASIELTEAVRGIDPRIAAVLWCSRMPVDIRHGAKVDRALLAAEASDLLAGHR